ncbi:MAG: hypothetical protein RL689_2449 [Planctomycetota bacterium]
MAHVEPPISRSVTRKACLRPTMSPKAPKKIAPKGRTTKPVAKVASVARRATVSLPLGKNDAEMIVASDPKM